MKLSNYNASIASGLVVSIRGFSCGSITLDEVQASLQTAIPLFENDGSGVAEIVRIAEADLEKIQFAVLAAGQRAAAITRLGDLQSVIEGGS